MSICQASDPHHPANGLSIDDDLILGLPGWTQSERYDIQAKVDNDDVAKRKALQGQLGLKLEYNKNPIDVIVIDHIEKPSAN